MFFSEIGSCFEDSRPRTLEAVRSLKVFDSDHFDVRGVTCIFVGDSFVCESEIRLFLCSSQQLILEENIPLERGKSFR